MAWPVGRPGARVSAEEVSKRALGAGGGAARALALGATADSSGGGTAPPSLAVETRLTPRLLGFSSMKTRLGE